MNTSHIELLAPAGSFESLHAAINAGCDAVYFGLTQLNMRARSSMNFSVEDLGTIVTTCRKHNIRCYLALNTILYDHDLRLMRALVNEAKKKQVDAIIASDMAAILYAREQGVEVHISTQLSVSNIESVQFYSQFADRIVLARELTLPMIKHITKEIEQRDIRGPKGKLVELEVFTHGAMCVAISGRCGMSLHTHNASANRGACKQNCRKAYTVKDKETGMELVVDNDFVMSPKDLCTIGLLDTIIDTGATVLKLEGRGRSPEYVDTVVRCYKAALTALEEGEYSAENILQWNEDLGTVYHRGLATGFYLGIPWDEWSGTAHSRATKEKEYVGKILHYYPKAQVAHMVVEGKSVAQGNEILITGTTTGVVRGTLQTLLHNDTPVEKAEQGASVTFQVPAKVRANDKCYIVHAVQR